MEGGGYPGEIELRFIQELEDWILGGGRVSWSRHQTWGRRNLTQVYLGPIYSLFDCLLQESLGPP